MSTNLSLSNFELDKFPTTHDHLPKGVDPAHFSSSSISSSRLTYQSHRPVLPHSRDHDWELVHGHTIIDGSPTRRKCHFMDLSKSIRHRIYELALDLDAPRHVFINYDHEWRRLHLTQGEKIQHTAGIIKVELKKPSSNPKRKDRHGNLIHQEDEHRRLSFTLREFSRAETKTMSRALWPSIFRVSREARSSSTKTFYRNATFTAPSDPWTIPEWEARLPIVALQYLSQNRNLVMEHVCCEAQQWRCLRNYLFNHLRQPYQVIDSRRLANLWGSSEIELRRQLPSMPWRFKQLYTIDEKFHYDGILYPNSKLDLKFGLHEVLHSEFLAEVQRIYRTPDETAIKAQLYYLAYGMRSFFEKIMNLEEFDGFVELANWLEGWLNEPLGPVPCALYERRCPGGLFFGMHMWENDIMIFAKDLQRNAKGRR